MCNHHNLEISPCCNENDNGDSFDTIDFVYTLALVMKMTMATVFLYTLALVMKMRMATVFVYTLALVMKMTMATVFVYTMA